MSYFPLVTPRRAAKRDSGRVGRGWPELLVLLETTRKQILEAKGILLVALVMGIAGYTAATTGVEWFKGIFPETIPPNNHANAAPSLFFGAVSAVAALAAALNAFMRRDGRSGLFAMPPWLQTFLQILAVPIALGVAIALTVFT